MADADYLAAHRRNSGSGIADDWNEEVCLTCHRERDRRGICECDGIELICAWCNALICEGWTGEDGELLSHGICESCAEKQA